MQSCGFYLKLKKSYKIALYKVIYQYHTFLNLFFSFFNVDISNIINKLSYVINMIESTY